MRTRRIPALALAAFALILAVLAAPTVRAEPKDLRWGTSGVGTVGHKALIALAALMAKELPEYRIAVLPLPSSSDSLKRYAVGEYEAFYTTQIAFQEFANDSGRFKGFRAAVKREPLQAFWGYTIETGLGIRAKDADKITSWSDLAGKRVFTCPLAFDIRAQLERAFSVLGIKHRYVQVDLSTVGPQLNNGVIDATCVYVSAKVAPAPWLAEASLSADWAILNPSAEEISKLRRAGMFFTDLAPKVFGRDIHAQRATLSVVLSGFGITPEVPAEDLERMLGIIESHARELARSDPSYRQVARDMVGLQRRGISTSPASYRIHPGLARYLRARNAWNPAWDARVYDG